MERLPARVRGQDYSTSRDLVSPPLGAHRDRSHQDWHAGTHQGRDAAHRVATTAQTAMAGSARTALPSTVTHDRIDMSQDNPDKAAGSPEPDEHHRCRHARARGGDGRSRRRHPGTRRRAGRRAGRRARRADEDVVVEELDAYVVPAGTVVVTGPSLVARLGAEAFGTFTLVLVGLGIALYSTVSGLGGTLGVALGFGIAVLAGDHRRRPRLGRALQPGRHARRRHRWPDGLEGRPALLARAARRRHPRRRDPVHHHPGGPPGPARPGRRGVVEELLQQRVQRLRRALAAVGGVAGPGRVLARHRAAGRDRRDGRVRRHHPRRDGPPRPRTSRRRSPSAWRSRSSSSSRSP